MRNLTLQTFSIKKVIGSEEFIPIFVTFSTGNIDTGGVGLNP